MFSEVLEMMISDPNDVGTDHLGARGGPNLEVGPAFLVSVFLAWQLAGNQIFALARPIFFSFFYPLGNETPL